MPPPVKLRVLGLRVDIECMGAQADALADAVMAAWERCLVPLGAGTDEETTRLLTVSVGPLARAPLAADVEDLWAPMYASSIPELLHHLSSRVTALAIDAQAGRAFLFHAGAVSLDGGSVAGFVGASGAGKTTLMSHVGLTRGYVTDETLCVRPGGEVLPYPKPLSVVTGGSVKRQESPSLAGLADPPTGPLTLGALFLIDRRPGHAPSIEDIPLLRALAEVGTQMSYLPRMEKPLQSLAELAESVGGIRRLVFGDAADVPAFLASSPGTRP